MRYVRRTLAVLALTACTSESSPPAPSTPTEPRTPVKASFSGLIVAEGGLCIPGASVLVVNGQRAGERLQQEPWCDAWSLGGFTFTDLTPDVEMTLRASAPGYADLEKRIVPSSYSVGSATLFVLEPE